jgi:hypothetical protein
MDIEQRANGRQRQRQDRSSLNQGAAANADRLTRLISSSLLSHRVLHICRGTAPAGATRVVCVVAASGW